MTCGPTGKQALENPAGKLGAGHDVIMIAEVIAATDVCFSGLTRDELNVALV